MDRDIKSGTWVAVATEEEYEQYISYGHLTRTSNHARVQHKSFKGPGWYRMIQYSQSCPRNCCMDTVRELISAKDYVKELGEEITELYDLFAEAEAKTIQTT